MKFEINYFNEKKYIPVLEVEAENFNKAFESLEAAVYTYAQMINQPMCNIDRKQFFVMGPIWSVSFNN